ncbi:MAG TPA: response regulator [Anaerolineae bacterium]|nr:response regulator [Anaerolineae bacterium]HMR64591.1 response regulator [Anaerolineae bacterium]
MATQLRILSIEDDPEMRGLIQLIFERQGHRVIGVKQGDFGLEFLHSLKPDVLLLDLMLPDIDGWEIYRQMKNDKELCKIPVIIVSARNKEQDAAAGYKVVGKDRFIEKPFEVQHLINAVNEVAAQLPVQ